MINFDSSTICWFAFSLRSLLTITNEALENGKQSFYSFQRYPVLQLTYLQPIANSMNNDISNARYEPYRSIQQRLLQALLQARIMTFP